MALREKGIITTEVSMAFRKHFRLRRFLMYKKDNVIDFDISTSEKIVQILPSRYGCFVLTQVARPTRREEANV